jgi:TolA-binding protein
LRKLDDVIADRHADGQLKEKAQFKKIAILSEMGQKEVSLTALEQYFSGAGSENKPAAARALAQKAELLAEIGKTDEALAVFGQLRRDHPGTDYAKSALYQSGVALVKAGRPAEAKKSFREYAQLYPEDEDTDLALLQVVQTDLDAKDFAEAFRGAEDFIRQKPQSPHLDIAYYKLGVASTGLGRHGHASFAFAKVTEDFPSSRLYAESLYGTAVSFENAGKLGQAIPLYERLLREQPEHALSRQLLPRLSYLYIENKDFGKALTHTEDLLFKDTDAPLETDGVFWIVQYLLDQGLYDRLERILDVLPARFPDTDLKHETFFFRAERAMGMKDYASAKTLYSQAIEAAPEDGKYVPHAYLGRGTAEAALNENDPASLDFTEALRFDHEIKVSMRARFELANLRLKARDYENASKDFMLVAILYDDPKYTPPALFKAGECFERIGKKDEAQKAFLELTTKYPENGWAKKVKASRR